MEKPEFINAATSLHGHSVTVDVAHSAKWLPRALIRRAARAVLEGEGAGNAHVGVVLCDDEMIRYLNACYLGHDWATDVISFPLGSDPLDGEIYISVDTARHQAAEAGVSLRNELVRLVVHGVLHLLGYDDCTEVERQRMHARQEEYVERILQR